MRPIALFGALVLAAGAAAQDVPEDYTAEHMLELCSGTVSDVPADLQSFICTFRIQGVADTMRANCETITFGFRPASELTVGAIPSRGAARQAFKNYMEAHPEVWGVPWSIAVSSALSETFPCENL